MSAPSATAGQRLPVLIVGGGPAGLSLALFLTRQGVHPTLVERRAGTGDLPRAFSLQARTMEILRAAGVEQAVRDASAGAGLAHLRGILSVETLAGDPGRWVLPPDVPTFDPGPLSPVGGVCCPQDLYEPVLARAAVEAGAQIEFGSELVDFEQGPDEVLAVIRSEDGQMRTVHAAYLVAADGADSPVRECLGVPRSGRGTLVASAINVLFRADLSAAVNGRTFFMCTAFNPRASVALTPRDASGTWSMLGVALDGDGQPVRDYTPARCAQLVRDAVGVEDLPVEVLRAIPWRSGMRIADRFRTRRVFLVGDAAHTMSPSGGYGANTAIHDSHNLAWKLAAVLQGWAGDGLLDSYDAERRPVAWATAEQAALRTITGHQGPGGGGRPAIRDDFTIMFGHRYDSSAVLGAEVGEPLPERLDLTALPGTRAPHAVRTAHSAGKAPQSVLDQFGRRFVLLTTGDRRWSEAVGLVHRRFGLTLEECRLDSDPHGADGAVLQAYGLASDDALLVRPDGFVAWRSDGSPEDAWPQLAEIFARLLGLEATDEDGTGRPSTPEDHCGRATDCAF
ncbi:FAD-dependent monooxygenase [Streptomyces sp. NPDC088752]|uniref:FAD-dependent monooxygenase n=1 Tax=Streptomyces sp. NPDC088752 TaxID=3154963 RepID=UPI003417C0E1